MREPLRYMLVESSASSNPDLVGGVAGKP